MGWWLWNKYLQSLSFNFLKNQFLLIKFVTLLFISLQAIYAYYPLTKSIYAMPRDWLVSLSLTNLHSLIEFFYRELVFILLYIRKNLNKFLFSKMFREILHKDCVLKIIINLSSLFNSFAFLLFLIFPLHSLLFLRFFYFFFLTFFLFLF